MERSSALAVVVRPRRVQHQLALKYCADARNGLVDQRGDVGFGFGAVFADAASSLASRSLSSRVKKRLYFR
jgi:hypothetical protein